MRYDIRLHLVEKCSLIYPGMISLYALEPNLGYPLLRFRVNLMHLRYRVIALVLLALEELRENVS